MSIHTLYCAGTGDAAQAASASEVPRAIDRVHKAFQSRLELDDTDPIDVILAALVSVKEDDMPLWLMLVAPPGSGKTEMLVSLNGLRGVRLISRITPQTLISGWGSRGNRSSLLKRLPDRSTLVVKDFTTLLKTRPENRGEIFSQLREVYDGAYSASFGTGADVEWSGRLGMLAGVTNIIDQTSPYEQMLGERFLKIRLKAAPRLKTARKALGNTARDRQVKQALMDAVSEFMSVPRRNASQVRFTKARKDEIANLADLIAVARTTANRHPYTREIVAIAEPEGPSRLARQFGLLARLLAAVRGNAQVEDADMATTCRVGFDSLIPVRLGVLSALRSLDEESGVTVERVSERLSLPRSTTRHYLEDAHAVKGGLVARVASDAWALSPRAKELFERLNPYLP